MSLLADDGQSSTGRYMNVMIGLSLALHVMALLLIAGLRLPNRAEHPLAAYQVSLVTLPTPRSEDPKPISPPIDPEPPKTLEHPKTPAPPKAVEPPVARSTQQAAKETPSLPPQPVRLAPTPHVRALEPIPTKSTAVPPAPKIRQDVTPPPVPVPPVPVMRQSEAKPVPTPVPPAPRPALTRDVLRGIAQPEVPKLGQVNPVPAGTPKETRSQTQTDVQKMLNNLTVPESAPVAPLPITPQPVAPQPVTPQPMRSTPPRSSMSEEVNRQLQKLEQAPPKLEPIKTPMAAEPQVASKPPAARTPMTTIQASGVAAGNPYIALVQRLISAQWTAPQVGLSGEPFQVLVKFRLDKTGKVSGLVVERASGNEYYDLAALRAIRTAILPSFPPDMTQAYFDAHFSFAVGEPVS